MSINMGLNTLYGENMDETNRIVAEIEKEVNENGFAYLSWSCEGRTRHFWQSEQWESNLKDKYDFEIGYNYYCKVTKRDDSNKVYIDMKKNDNEVWYGKPLLNNSDLLNEIEQKMNENKKVILRFPQIPNNEYQSNIMFYADDINGTINHIEFIKKGRTRINNENNIIVIEYIIGG